MVLGSASHRKKQTNVGEVNNVAPWRTPPRDTLSFNLSSHSHVTSGVHTCGPVVSSTAALLADPLSTVGCKVGPPQIVTLWARPTGCSVTFGSGEF